jgi:cell division protease FtsH
LRPGRFELQIEIPAPNADDRREIARIYRERFALDMSDEALEHLVTRTEDFADYENQLRYSGDHLHAAFRALKRKEIRSGAYTVTKGDIDSVLQRRTQEVLVVSENELRTVAYHEAGHAICAHVLPHTPGVRKVSIVPGEMNLPALGIMLQQARENKHLVTREEFLDHIAVTLGGRIGEELALHVTGNGALNDLYQASQVARAMVEELGMGETIGIQALRVPAEGGTRRRDIGDALAAKVDGDVQAILGEAEQRARETIGERLALLHHLAGLLLEHKTLEDQALADAWQAA